MMKTRASSSSSSLIITGPSRIKLTTLPLLVTITIIIAISSPPMVDGIDNFCQKPDENGVMKYDVCMGDPLKVLSPNVSNYRLAVEPPSATCGQALQFYCTMTIPTQCFNCSNASLGMSHPAEYMVDEKDGNADLTTWWQSLTWRMSGNVPKADIKLSMGRRYIIQDIIRFTFASRLPKQAILEKSIDNGQTWTALQYYNYTCAGANKTLITSPNDVICTQEYSSEFPESGGELKFDITRDRLKMYLGDSLDDYSKLYEAYQNTPLLEFLTFTDLRLRLLYPATDGQEIIGKPADKFKYYYAISNIYLVAGCECNRHAQFCGLQNGRMVCMCEHNTAGDSCEVCLPLYNNRPWQTGSFVPYPYGIANQCEKCECYNRAINCSYDSTLARGRCLGCTNNTQGDRCDVCVPGFFLNQSLPLTDTRICVPCSCEPFGIENGNTICRDYTGQCQCKFGVMGSRCDTCYDQTWGLLTNDTTRGTCKPCNCNIGWTIDGRNTCDQNTGQCYCVSGVDSRDCSLCVDGYFKNTNLNTPRCDPCLCNLGGSYNYTCDQVTNQCPCRPNMAGARCRFVTPSFYVPFPDRLNLKPDPAATTCQTRSEIVRPDAPYTGRMYFACSSSEQVAKFNNLLGSIEKQGTVVQSYVPAIRYTLNDTNPFAEAKLIISPGGVNSHFNASLYPNLTSTDCNTSYPVVTFELFNLLPGFGQAWVNMSGMVNLDARCIYNAEFKPSEKGGTTSPFLLDSLVLIPDVTQSTVYFMEISDDNKAEYGKCLKNLVPLLNQFSSIFCDEFYVSLMAEQAGGGLPCECDPVGSLNASDCPSLGGQCGCKANVGGRRCDYCRPGYYGLNITGCLNCDCNPGGSSSLVCDYTTGQCPCLTNVAVFGENTTVAAQLDSGQCMFCKTGYYGITSGQGCKSCDCNPMGNVSSECSEDGTCQCKPTIGGAKCETCLPGYSGFSADGCQQCNCSTVGSTNSSCGQDGQCFCQANVVGQKCDTCKNQTFNLSPTNPDACQPCFCSGMSGTTTQCTSALGFKTDVITSPDTSDWTRAPDLASHVMAPSKFLGDKRSSYGQLLSFTITSPLSFLPGKPQYVILRSTDGRRISYTQGNVNFTGGQTTVFMVQLYEKLWYDNNNPSVPLTALDMYGLLSKLSMLLIQQTFLNLYPTTISSVSLVSAAPTTDISSQTISYVENCTCLYNTAGLSCEKCQQGYRRSNDGQCVECFCKYMNLTSRICDELTGQCINCPNGSSGASCDKLGDNVEEANNAPTCKKGFWGLSQNGCQPCTCHPVGSVDTTDCDKVNGSCNCKPNVTGSNCDRCTDGFVDMGNTGCKPCGGCYGLVVIELNLLSEMLQNQSNTFNQVKSTSSPDFVNLLNQFELTSAFLGRFDNNFANNQKGFADTINNISTTYQLLSNLQNTALEPLQLDISRQLTHANVTLQASRVLIQYASLELLLVSKGFPAMDGTSNMLQNLTSSLQQIKLSMDGAIFPLRRGFDDLNNTVATLENNAVALNILVANLTDDGMRQILPTNQQLNATLVAIETKLKDINATSVNLKVMAINVKVRALDLLNRTTLAASAVKNVNSTVVPDIQGLSTNLSVSMPNTAANYLSAALNLLSRSTSLGSIVQNVTQMTSALVARINDFQKQIDSMTTRVSAANQTTNGAVNRSATALTNAVNMLDVMTNFVDKANNLRGQATSAIQSAEYISQASRSALNTSNVISTSIEPVLAISGQALTLTNGTSTRCLEFNQTLGPLLDRSNQLKGRDDLLLNDVSTKLQAAISSAQSANFSSIIADQSNLAAQLSQQAITARDGANQAVQNISDVSKKLSDLSAKFHSISPLTTTGLNSLLVQCNEARLNFNILNLPLSVQNLQVTSTFNQQWIGGLLLKRQELHTQLERLNKIVARFI